MHYPLAKNSTTLPAAGMNLALTLGCGQTFSWQALHKPDEFWGVAGHYAIIATQEKDNLVLRRPDNTPLSLDELDYWKHYFALDVDYPSLLSSFCLDETLKRCVDFGRGIRVLRQPFFDTLLSFIITQSNHLSRIGGIVQRLCQQFGPSLADGLWGFPSPDTLAECTSEDLADLRAGYRAPYLIDAAKKTQSGQVTEALLQTLSTSQARTLLCTIHGVGDKVANCVLLFSLERTESLPKDVWMKRALAEIFPNGLPPQTKGVEGIAQQYIFYWSMKNLPRGKRAKSPPSGN